MPDRTESILVLGGGGFLGSHLLENLLRNGYRNILSVSRSLPENPLPGIAYHEGGDITKPETIAPFFEGRDIVVNASGMVSFFQKDRQQLLDINHGGTLNALHLAEKKGVQRFIQISSTAAFGFSDEVITEESVFPWDCFKNLPYAYSKYAPNNEIMQSPIASNIVYPSLLLGPKDENTKKIIAHVQGKKRIFAPPGKNSFIDVRDAAEGVMLVMEKAPSKENYILAGGNLSFADLFRGAAEALGQKTAVSVLPKYAASFLTFLSRIAEPFQRKIEAEKVFLGFQNRVHSTEKIRGLGFEPQFSLEKTFSDFLTRSSL